MISSQYVLINILIYTRLLDSLNTYVYVTGFTKTVPIGTRNEIQFIVDY